MVAFKQWSNDNRERVHLSFVGVKVIDLASHFHADQITDHQDVLQEHQSLLPSGENGIRTVAFLLAGQLIGWIQAETVEACVDQGMFFDPTDSHFINRWWGFDQR
ncbi:hypothetical protein [Deinococcus cellulosilyticus]|uniref:Uncharacterized protein n=1 Tax=Deinococcus cellulosilyticus (strain DSM 18568 / NBRC 106333 / KACC 11606 / 5516J-15) TaxID=1223518 RepID=A0A511NBE0_DEIC1|nr:hypothetical protein [Deinococcus cellulosilyticus]GEM50139.1 hypothetical protein DC3_57740 [Deinococcus cellulosilyticus NBRC 106333 = KACC 11606]